VRECSGATPVAPSADKRVFKENLRPHPLSILGTSPHTSRGIKAKPPRKR